MMYATRSDLKISSNPSHTRVLHWPKTETQSGYNLHCQMSDPKLTKICTFSLPHLLLTVSLPGLMQHTGSLSLFLFPSGLRVSPRTHTTHMDAKRSAQSERGREKFLRNRPKQFLSPKFYTSRSDTCSFVGTRQVQNRFESSCGRILASQSVFWGGKKIHYRYKPNCTYNYINVITNELKKDCI